MNQIPRANANPNKTAPAMMPPTIGLMNEALRDLAAGLWEVMGVSVAAGVLKVAHGVLPVADGMSAEIVLGGNAERRIAATKGANAGVWCAPKNVEFGGPLHTAV
jgi:hypothetical protein